MGSSFIHLIRTEFWWSIFKTAAYIHYDRTKGIMNWGFMFMLLITVGSVTFQFIRKTCLLRHFCPHSHWTEATQRLWGRLSWRGQDSGCQACASGLLSSAHSKVSRTLRQKLHWLQRSVSHGSVFIHCCVRVLLGFMMQVDYISPSDPSDTLNCTQTAVLLGNPTRTSFTLGGMWILPSSLKTYTNRR